MKISKLHKNPIAMTVLTLHVRGMAHHGFQIDTRCYESSSKDKLFILISQQFNNLHRIILVISIASFKV